MKKYISIIVFYLFCSINTQAEHRYYYERHKQYDQRHEHVQRHDRYERPEPRTWEESRSRRWDREHRTWVDRGGYRGYCIPERHYHYNFGRTNRFRITTRPSIYLGHPCFNYSGYRFILVDPWPEYWSNDWYLSDEVYIIYDNGYYLCNPRYPNVRIAIAIIL